MTLHPTLLLVWSLLSVGFLALLVYRGQLTRYEDEQLFLSEDVNVIEQDEQRKIVSRVNRITPLVTLFGGAAGLVTASVVGLYVWNAWKSIP